MTYNKYIISDCLYGLDRVEKNSIKMIYIDPPYNTQTQKIYNDKQGSEDWINFISLRLQKAHSKLKDDGVIFISIDDNELANLIIICDDIWGKANKLGVLITRQATRSNSKHINTIHEYVLVYAKNKKKLHKLEVCRIDIPFYSKVIKNITREVQNSYKNQGQQKAQEKLRNLLSHYKHIDGFSWIKNYNIVDEKGRVCSTKDLSTPSEPSRLVISELRMVLPKLKNRGWISKEKIIELFNQDMLIFKGNRPYKKAYIEESKDSLMSILNFYSRQGCHDLEKLNLKNVFDTPKPVEMIKLFIKATCKNKNDVVLDFFGGSATTAQAVLEVNKEQNKHMSFILIQQRELLYSNSKTSKILKENNFDNCISNVGILRIRRVLDIMKSKDDFVIDEII